MSDEYHCYVAGYSAEDAPYSEANGHSKESGIMRSVTNSREKNQ